MTTTREDGAPAELQAATSPPGLLHRWGQSVRPDLFQTICAQATVGHVSLEPGTGAMAILVVRAMLFNGNLQRQYFAVAIDCQNFNGNLQRQF